MNIGYPKGPKNQGLILLSYLTIQIAGSIGPTFRHDCEWWMGGVVGRSVNEGGGWKLRFEMHKGNGKMAISKRPQGERLPKRSRSCPVSFVSALEGKTGQTTTSNRNSQKAELAHPIYLNSGLVRVMFETQLHIFAVLCHLV